MFQPPTVNQPVPQAPNAQQQIAPPRQETSVRGTIGNLVVLCNDHIARYHEYMFSDAQELVNELLMFRTDFENVYLNTNLYILYTKSGAEISIDRGMTIEGDRKVYFTDLCGDLEKWFTLREYPEPEQMQQAFTDGEVLCKLYQKVLIIAGLYNPAEV